MPLFGQRDMEFPTWLYVIAIVAIALLFVGFFFWLVFRHAAKSREFSHLERMKALELGKPAEPSEAEHRLNKDLHNAFWISFWLGAGVPAAATAAAGAIMIETRLHDFGLMWICVAVISVAGVVCATVLMIRCRARLPKEQDRPRAALADRRPPPTTSEGKAT
jgi:heme/copper-type cytochrome/quinol oxidase subunit 2